MTNLTLKISCLGDPGRLPAWVAAKAPGIARHLRDASSGAIDPAIEVLKPSKPQSASSTVDLHLALRTAIRGQQDTIALLLCNRFEAQKDLFGIMFDTGFAIDNSSLDPVITGLPRQGCAVFMEPISEVRHDAEYSDQVLFTSIHEIGHVFNLAHFEDQPNFMKTSARDTPYDLTYFDFIDAHKVRLAHGKTDQTVWPGGSDFGDTGLHHVEDDPFRHAGIGGFGTEIAVSLARRVVNYFDPIELDVEVRVVPGAAGVRRVPNAIDPGYEIFRLWIEEPDGSRRQYRSPRRYCWNGQEIEVSADRPFLRDISIFGQAGGYTFKRSGVHRLWVELLLPGGGTLTSSAVEFEIIPAELTSAIREGVFTTRDSKVLLYHRTLRRGLATGKKLDDYISEVPGDPAAASVHYSLGRACLEQSARLERGGKPDDRSARIAARDRGRLQLERALASAHIGRRQRQIAEAFLMHR